MFSSVTILSTSLAMAVAQYNVAPVHNADPKMVAKPGDLAEAYVTGKNFKQEDAGAIYYSVANKGKADWAPPQKLVGHNLVDPRGVALCGPKGANGQHNWLYVADAGNKKHGGYVYRYKIDRNVNDASDIKVGVAETVYGEGSGEQRPTDVACDEAGNVWWTDEAVGDIRWTKADVLNSEVCASHKCSGDVYVDNNCEKAVEHVQGLEVVGNWVYWSNNEKQVDPWAPEETEETTETTETTEEEEQAAEAETDETETTEETEEEDDDAFANHGVWRAPAAGFGAKCNQCLGADEYGKIPSSCSVGSSDIEFFSQDKHAPAAIAGHDNWVYAVAQDNKVYSLGENDAAAGKVAAKTYASGNFENAQYVADAGDRGLLVVDEKSQVYVVNDKAQSNHAFNLPSDFYSYGAAYQEAADDLDVEDSAITVAVSCVMALVATVALF